MKPSALTVAVALALACAPALREPPPVSALAPGRSAGHSTPELLRAGDEAWRRRANPSQAEAAQALYLDAAAADDQRVDGLLGAMRAIAFRLERERDASTRARLSEEGVQLGQWCQRRAPSDPACDYRLAIALGQQAREHRSTGKDALGTMVDLLRRAIAASPTLDAAGPHRMLALVLLRAPGWPVGPGDPEAALAQAREAVRLFPGSAENQLVLAEALARNGSSREAVAAYDRALQLATAAREAGDPDAERWEDDATAGIRKAAGG